MSVPSTVHELLQAGDDGSVAISGIDRPALTYRELRKLVANTAETLNSMGIGRNDRIAIVLPNGPEMATAFVAIAACATTAPLNPAYTKEEYDFYLSDLNARALLVEKGSHSPAIDAAKAHNIQLIELDTRADLPAGSFTLAGIGNGRSARSDKLGMATLRSSCTHPAPHRDQKSYRSATGTSAPLRQISRLR